MFIAIIWLSSRVFLLHSIKRIDLFWCGFELVFPFNSCHLVLLNENTATKQIKNKTRMKRICSYLYSWVNFIYFNQNRAKSSGSTPIDISYRQHTIPLLRFWKFLRPFKYPLLLSSSVFLGFNLRFMMVMLIAPRSNIWNKISGWMFSYWSPWLWNRMFYTILIVCRFIYLY